MTLNKSILFISLVFVFFSCKKEEIIEEMPEESIACIPDALQDNVIAFYPFSNGSLDDFSGDEHNLSNSTTASPTTDRNGNADCAYIFDNLVNSTEFLTTTDTEFLHDLASFSIALWYEPLNDSRDGARLEKLINLDLEIGCPDRDDQWFVGLYDCRRALFSRTNAVWDQTLMDSPTFDCAEDVKTRTNVWSHLVATFDGTKMSLYKDGEFQASVSGDYSCNASNPIMSDDIRDLFLGKDYTGRIDDVIIFDKSFSQTEIDQIFELEPCCEEE